MKQKNTMSEKRFVWHRKGLLCAVGLLLILTALTTALMRPFAGACNDLREKVVRLHVLANSDSETDQALKLQVRDAVLRQAEQTFAGAKDKEETLLLAERQKEVFVRTAEETLRRAGNDASVQIEICNTFFNKRVYEDGTTLPAGNYDALRVVIGNGAGHNWWCMLFPKICLSPAGKQENKVALSTVFTPEEVEITTKSEDYQVRFFLLDAYEELRHWLSGE